MKGKCLFSVLFAFAVVLGGSSAWGQGLVKITPLGAEANRFCRPDRALLFEDPTGVRVLIAPGRTVNGSGDPRLGAPGSVHVLLIDHPHVDHIGDVLQNCAGAKVADFAFPNEGNAPEIAAGHKSAVLVGGELPDFFTQKIKNITGVAPAGCPAAGLDNTFTVPRTSPCVGVIRGGTRTAVFTGQSAGVKITTIPAFHAAGAPRVFIDPPNVPAGLTGYAGHETGYVIRFTNGLAVLWTGDSGLIGDWETQSRFYKVNLAIPHIGDLFTMGPDESAFAVNELIKPRTTIPEHANEISDPGNLGAKAARFVSLLKGGIVPIIPFSGVDILCDGAGNCTQ